MPNSRRHPLAAKPADRAETEQALTERKFVVAFYDSPYAALLLDLDTELIVDVNKTFERWAGVTRQEVVGRKMEDVQIRWVDPSEQARAVAIAKETGLLQEFPARIGMKDGTERNYSLSAKTILVNDQRLLLVMANDVTERLRAERAATRAKAEWERTFNAVPDLVAIIGTDFKIARVNRALAERLGLKADDCVGRPCHEVLHAEGQPPAWCPHCLTGTDQDEHSVEVHDERLGGDFQITTTPLRDENGQFAGVVEVGRDISENKRAEMELRTSESRFRALVEAGAQVVYRMSPDWSQMLVLFGGALLADTLDPSSDWMQRYIPTDEQPRVRAAIAEAISTGRVFELEHRMRRKDGSEGWTFSRAIPVKDDRGKIMEWFGATSDVTGLKEAEQARSQLSAIVTASDDALISESEDGIILTWNAGAERLFGYRAEEAIGQPISLLTPAGRQEESALILARIREGRHIGRFDTINVGKDGRLIDVSLTISPIRDGSGRVRGAALIAHDISDRKLAQEALQQAKDYLDSVINSIGDPVFVKDSMHRFVLINTAYCRFFGLTREGIIGKTGAEFLPNKQLDSIMAQDDRVLASGTPESSELQIDDASGRPRIIRVVKTLYADRVGSKFVVGTLVDITAQKDIEAQLKDVAQLRTDLISLVNHEYANVLTNMKLALTLLKASEAGAQDEARRHSYEVLGRAIENLRVYTTNFLNLHRLESGKFELNIKPTPAGAVVSDSLVTLRPQAEAKGQRINLAMALPEQSPVAVRADRDCLALIVNNLVTNAIKYTPQGGAITVRAQLEEEAPGQVVRIAVEDTGIGIAAEDLQRIQEGFYRTQAGREVAKGFGVGLKVVSELLSKHGSRLEISSEPGKGSRFSFRLPVWNPD